MQETGTTTTATNGRTNLNENENGDSLRLEFDAKRIAFRTLLDDEDVLHSDHIVVRWDDEYVIF